MLKSTCCSAPVKDISFRMGHWECFQCGKWCGVKEERKELKTYWKHLQDENKEAYLEPDINWSSVLIGLGTILILIGILILI